MRKQKTNYEKQVELARELFRLYDLKKAISRFGLEHDKEAVFIEFFGSVLRIDRKKGFATHADSGREAGFNAAMSVYDVLCYSKDNAALSGEWQTLQNLSPHSNFGAAGKDVYDSAAVEMSGRLGEVRAACERLGGLPYTTADVGYKFNAFPFLPVVFQLWEGDEEFPSKVSFLFDKATLDFIHFETAWYVASELKELILREMGITVPGLRE